MNDNNLDSIPPRFFSWKQIDIDTSTWSVKTRYARGYSIFEGKLILFWATGAEPLLTVPKGEWEGLQISKQPPEETDPVQPDPVKPKNTKFTWS